MELRRLRFGAKTIVAVAEITPLGILIRSAVLESHTLNQNIPHSVMRLMMSNMSSASLS